MSEAVPGKNPGEEVFFKSGDIILKEGDTDSVAYRILDGKVEVFRKGAKGDVALAALEKGAIVGEMSLIDKMPRSASVKALTDVKAVKIDCDRFTQEIKNTAPVFQELMSVFINRLRKADHTMIVLSDAEQKQKKIAELTREEINVLSHLARTGIELQNIFKWETAYDWIVNSLKDIGFSDFKLTTDIKNLKESYSVNQVGEIKEGIKFELCFLGEERSGKLELTAPQTNLSDRYENILTIYAALLSSCLFKSEMYEAFSNIARHVEHHISDTRVQSIASELKSAIEHFSNRTLDVFMEIPERIKAGEKIEDILFELTMGFQEIDRLVQEVDLLIKVFNNILGIAKGKLPADIKDLDKHIDEKGDQSLVDEIFS
ncbi:Crp/Fnr family transcriptional regulator [candidate division KSB1 bacterium]